MTYTPGTWTAGSTKPTAAMLNNAETQYDEVITEISACSGSDVAASRYVGTNYQNTSGKMMVVVIGWSCPQGGIDFYIGETLSGDPLKPVYQVIVDYISTALSGETSFTFLIPKGWYYRVEDFLSGLTLTHWYEYTLY